MKALESRVIEWMSTNWERLQNKDFSGGYRAPENEESFRQGGLWIELKIDRRECEIDKGGKACAPIVSENPKKYYVEVEHFLVDDDGVRDWRVKICLGQYRVVDLHRLAALRAVLGEAKCHDYASQVVAINRQIVMLRHQDRVKLIVR